MNAEMARATLIASLSPRYGAGEAASIARIVLEDGFGIKPGATTSARVFSAEEKDKFHSILPRLSAGEPVQYVLGEAHFFGFQFKVNPAVLIPRQETEELVAWVLDYLKQYALPEPALLDIGLGSGCIGITIKAKYPRLHLYGLEKSLEALAVAQENAKKILRGGSFDFVEGDITAHDSWTKFPALDVVVSNPPYIPRSEENLVPEHVRSHEPSLALFVEHDDPLLFYRVIAEFALQKLVPGGALFFECNEFNAGEVFRLLEEKGFSDLELRADLSGADRMLAARVK